MLSETGRRELAIKLISSKDPGYHLDKDEIVARCLICGDSKKDQRKRRFAYNFKKDSWHCFNCQASGTIQSLLSELGESLDEYFFLVKHLQDSKESSKPAEPEKPVTPQKTYNSFITNNCVMLSKEDSTIPSEVIEYADKRGLFKLSFRFYYCHTDPRKKKGASFARRIIIPFFDRHGNCVWFQGRSVFGEDPKYLNVTGDKGVIFGLSEVTTELSVPILEGPIKALYAENAIATCQNQITDAQLKLIEEHGVTKEKLIIMFDYDLPGLESAMKWAIKGYRVFVYDKSFTPHEDLEDYCRKYGIMRYSLKEIEGRTFKGFAAQIHLKMLIKQLKEDK